MNCAPNKKGDWTCYSKEQLIKMAEALNKNNKNKIRISGKTKNQLWENIREELFDECEYEWCWLDNPAIKSLNDKELKDFTFKPAMPQEWNKNKYTWLTTTDISKVMRQYERLYNDFRFFGPVPVDCPKDIYCELTNVDINKMNKKGIKNLGVIFNLDRHYESGSHWVGLFIDTEEKRICYYDSTGHPPPGYIKYFMETLKRQMGDNVKMEHNRRKHQYGGSECGIYSMNFLIESLKGKKLEDFEKKGISDFSVNILRQYLYRPSKQTIVKKVKNKNNK